MSIILFLYIFALFVLFSPSILFKTHLLLHSLCFVLIMYFTYDLVLLIRKEDMRGLETEQNEIYDHELNVSFSNKHTSAPKSNIIGQTLINTFERIAEIKIHIKKLQTMIKAYDGTDENLVEINKLYRETQGRLKQVEDKLVKFNDMKKEFEELTNEINNLEVKKKQTQNKLNKCDEESTNGDITITNNNTKIEELRERLSKILQISVQFNSSVNLYNFKIPSKIDEIRSKISTCELQYLQNSLPWIQEYV